VKAYIALEKVTQQYVNSNKITGTFKDIIVNVNGVDVTVRGTVINGQVKIGTAFIPNRGVRNMEHVELRRS